MKVESRNVPAEVVLADGSVSVEESAVLYIRIYIYILYCI